MWFFALNGIAYVLYTFLSGEWRSLVPTRHSFGGAFHVLLHDLGLSKHPLPQQKFNDTQKIAYTGVVLMGMGSLLTGIAIYKPTQLHIITILLGGYEMARWFHFWLTLFYVVFPGACCTSHSGRMEQLPRHAYRVSGCAYRVGQKGGSL
jgi:thiosulfate reductase cytochrome b subunit